MFSKVIWSSFISNVLVRPLCWSDKYKECTYGSIQTAALAQNVENEGLWCGLTEHHEEKPEMSEPLRKIAPISIISQ